MAGHDVCSQKQAEVLRKHGYDVNMTFQQASQVIDRLKANGWVRPANDPANPFMAPGYQPGPQGPAAPAYGQAAGHYATGPSQYAQPVQQPAGNPYVQPPQGQPQSFQSQRDPNSPATEKQAAFLAQRGYTQPMSFGQASQLIDQIKNAGQPQQPQAPAYAAPPTQQYAQPAAAYAAPSPYAAAPPAGLPNFG